ncbi:MAG: flagellar hook basal-body protein [Candidatus Margulisiibacteriota bacterium]
MTDRIFEIGESGLDSADQKVRRLMDNMAGSEVPGYKQADVTVRGFPLALEGASRRLAAMKPQAESTFYNQTQGSLIKTNGKLDMALGGPGYFVVAGAWGEGFTRDGRFRLDKDGRMLTVAGNLPVLGENGPIVVPQGAEVEVSQIGEIKVDGVLVDRVRVVMPEDSTGLESLNGSIFKRSNSAVVMTEIEDPRVIQGYVESSNINIVDQMVEMMELERTYSINSKVIQTRGDMLTRAMELGRATQ